MSIGLQITVDTSQAEQTLLRIGRSLDGSKFMLAVGLSLIDWITANFESEGRKTGQAWAPLSPRTIMRRRKRGGGAKILQDIGRLKMSFTKAPNPDVKINGRGVSVTVGTETQYAIYHESSEPRRRLPRRPMLPTEKQAQTLATTLLNAYVAKVLRQSGG